MAEKKEEGRIINTTDKVKLYAPKGAKHYTAGQEVSIHPNQEAKFIGFGFSKSKEEAEKNDAHPAIAEKTSKSKKAQSTPATDPPAA